MNNDTSRKISRKSREEAVEDMFSYLPKDENEWRPPKKLDGFDIHLAYQIGAFVALQYGISELPDYFSKQEIIRLFEVGLVYWVDENELEILDDIGF